MKDNSITIKSLDGAPVLKLWRIANDRCAFCVHDAADGAMTGDDASFFVPAEHADRVRRAVEAFNSAFSAGAEAELEAAEGRLP